MGRTSALRADSGAANVHNVVSEGKGWSVTPVIRIDSKVIESIRFESSPDMRHSSESADLARGQEEPSWPFISKNNEAVFSPPRSVNITKKLEKPPRGSCRRARIAACAQEKATHHRFSNASDPHEEGGDGSNE